MKRVRPVAAGLLALVALAGCRSHDAESAGAGNEAVITVGKENIAVATVAELRSGPGISGTLEPLQSASVRAEVAGVVLKSYVEAGDRVKSGAVLARIDDVALQDAFLSARSGVRSAEASLDLARRDQERSERLAQAGAVADRDLERSRVQATNAEGALADAQARLASARKQLDHATVRAPFDGTVSERRVRTGDVVQVGAALFTVVQPGKLRLEGSVSTDQIGRLKVGTPVEFSVRGFDRPFAGRIERINPVVDPSTRQVRIQVAVPNNDGALVAGVFAEGRVATDSKSAVAAPLSVVDTRGTEPTVHKVAGGRVSEVPVKLGVRDEAAELVELESGVTAGDTLLLGSAQGVPVGSRVRVLENEVER